MSTDNQSIKIAFAMSVIEKVGEFLNTMTMCNTNCDING